jgi:hypothetical protein
MNLKLAGHQRVDVESLLAATMLTPASSTHHLRASIRVSQVSISRRLPTVSEAPENALISLFVLYHPKVLHLRAKGAMKPLHQGGCFYRQRPGMFSPVFRDTVGESRRKGTALVLATLRRTPSIAGYKHTSPARSAVHRMG